MVINLLINLTTLQTIYLLCSFFISLLIFLFKNQTFIELLFYICTISIWLERFIVKEFSDIVEIIVKNSVNLNLFFYILPFFYIFRLSVITGWSSSQCKDLKFLFYFINLYYCINIKYFNIVFDVILYNLFNLKIANKLNISLEFNSLILINIIWFIVILIFWVLTWIVLLNRFICLVLYLIFLIYYIFITIIIFLTGENLFYLLILKKLIYFN